MEKLLQKPFFKAVPFFTFLLIIVNNSFSRSQHPLPAWLSVSVFIILAILNSMIVFFNYRQGKKSAGYTVLLIGVISAAIACIYFYFLSNR